MEDILSDNWAKRNPILVRVLEQQNEFVDFLEYTHPKQFEQWQHSMARAEEIETAKKS